MKYLLFCALCLCAYGLSAQTDSTYTTLAASYPHRQNVQKLALDLRGPMPPAFWDSLSRYPNLRHLDLSHCRLQTFPKAICKLKNLQHLDLSYNYISALPKEIKNLRHLRSLRLRKNQLHALPDAITQLAQLTDADFTLNFLTTLPTNIGDLQQLRYLNLSFNCLSHLPPSLSNLQKAQIIDLKYNELQRRPDSLQRLPNAQAYILFGNPFTQERRAAYQKTTQTILHHIDNRDSSKFVSILVGPKRWMVSDLKYAAQLDSSSQNKQYLYAQNQLDSVCPDGWHVATPDDWRDLFSVASSEFPQDPNERLNSEIETTRKDLFSTREDPMIIFNPYEHICGRWDCLSAISRPRYGRPQYSRAHFPTQNFYQIDFETPKGNQPYIYYWAAPTDSSIPNIIEFNFAQQIREHCLKTPPVGRFRVRCVAD